MYPGRCKTSDPAMKHIALLVSLFLSFAFPYPVYSRLGELDKGGCHRDLMTGNYHCHRAYSGLLQSRASPQDWKQLRTVVKVIDGNTLELEGGQRVVLIGVDTPETAHPDKPAQHIGKEASAFTRRIVEGKKVRLEYDRQQKDLYGRILAYVYLEDGTFLNAEIIKQGYGFAFTKYPFKYSEQFRHFEWEARENHRGLWKE